MGRHRLGRGSPQRATRHPGDGLPPFSYEPSISTPTLLLGLDSVGVAESIAGYTGVIACREIMSRRLLAPRAAKGLWASNIGLVLLCLATAGCQGFSSGGGAGNGQLAVNPTSESLGSVQVGNSATVSGTLNASGATVTVAAASTNNSQFTIGGLPLPTVIPAGQSAPFTVTFSPQVAGAISAIVTFTSDAQPSATTAAATGTGTPAPTHTVSLSWTGSASPNISGYNIYRANYSSSCGTYSKINGPALDTATTYSDSSVVDGTNYCYATTAVNSSDEESAYSNIVSDVQIPAP